MAGFPISVLVAHDGSVGGGWLAGGVPPGSGIVVTRVVPDVTAGAVEVQESDADALLVVCGEEPDAALGLVRWWTANRPERPVIVLSAGSVNGFVERAFSSGADDLVLIDPRAEPSPDKQQQLVFALHKALTRRSLQSDDSGPSGELICVLGPKGGTGKTLTCVNLGVALVEMQKRVVLVDLDLQFGDIALALGLTPHNTIADLATSAGALDGSKLDAYLATHASGLRVLMAPTRPDQAGLVNSELLTQLYGALRSIFDFVIVDTAPAFTPETIASIDLSSQVCIVGALDAPSLKNTKLGLETLELMGYDPERIRLVLNRADSSVGITHNDVLSILGRAPDALIPSHRDVTRSVNEGSPIVVSRKRSPAAKAFRSLAGLYASLQVRDGQPPERPQLARSDA